MAIGSVSMIMSDNQIIWSVALAFAVLCGIFGPYILNDLRWLFFILDRAKSQYTEEDLQGLVKHNKIEYTSENPSFGHILAEATFIKIIFDDYGGSPYQLYKRVWMYRSIPRNNEGRKEIDLVCRLIYQTSLRKMPKYMNCKEAYVRAIVKWRLLINK